MVPSRSRNTAARKWGASGTLRLQGMEPRFRGGFYHIWRDSPHAAMIGWAVAKKTWAAVRLFLNDGAAGSNGGRAIRISGAKHGNDWQPHSSRHVHGSGIIADEKMTLREQRGEIRNGRF